MAIDTFKYQTQTQDGSPEQTETNDREVSFGSGYKQISANGLFVARPTYRFLYSGNLTVINDIHKFMKSHVVVPFIWTPPGKPRQVFRVVGNTISLSVIGKNKKTITADFEQFYTQVTI